MSKLRKWMMKEERENSSGSADTAIMLFGMTIAVSTGDSGSSKAVSLDAVPCVSQAGSEVDGASAQLEDSSLGSICTETGSRVESVSALANKGATSEPQTSVSPISAEPQPMCQDNKAGATTQLEKQRFQEQVKKEQCLRKPDKLIPCPRCDSLDTKFCYYNNYNINQPRHFCKSCQRYWTAGGTLRNVLVGAGRRKNKYGASQVKQDASENSALTSVRMDHHEPAQPMLPCPMNPYGSSVALKVPPTNLPRLQVPSQCSPLGVSESPGGSSVTSCGKDGASQGLNASAFSMHGGLGTQNVFSSVSAFKAAGAEMSSYSVSKLRQRTRTDSSDSKADCGSSMTSPTAETTRENTYVLSSRASQQQAEAAVWTKNNSPLGFFNGAWPYGYNVGWSGGGPLPAAPSLCTPQSSALGSGTPSASAQAWSGPPAGVWAGMWTSGMPQAGLPGMSAMPFGWNMCQGGWTLPWRPVPVVAVQASAPENCSSLKKRDSSNSASEERSMRGQKMPRLGDPEVAA